MMFFETIKKGEHVAVWNDAGQVYYVDGPARVFNLNRRIQRLTKVSAEPQQYLVVKNVDGSVEHVPGPAAIWFDPIQHAGIEAVNTVNIGSNEAVVTYVKKQDAVERNVVRGPVLYMPTANEWVHKFSWHGADPKNPRVKTPRTLLFTKLRTMPDQMYFDVNDVRTLDDALLTVKVMVFFELKDIEQMLDKTHDPVADFINALAADVIDLASGLPFEQFKEHSEKLNDLETYATLKKRATTIGYEVHKVVYIGYEAGGALQGMHDNAIEARTGLKLEAETEGQAQDLEDLKVDRNAERDKKRRELIKEQLEHKLMMEVTENNHNLALKKSTTEAETLRIKMLREAELNAKVADDQGALVFFNALKEAGVDLTKYLVAKNKVADKLIQFGGDKVEPRLHLHEN